MVKSSFLSKVALIGTGLAIGVMALGAFTRLMDAGLSCPDWPGCYGHWMIAGAAIKGPSFVAHKAWAEMAHRYVASTLSLFILMVFLLIIFKKENRTRANMVLAILLVLELSYQIMLGQWTVTMKLLPLVVTQHLLGGVLISGTLWLIYLNQPSAQISQPVFVPRGLIVGAVIGCILLLGQIFLGAWASTHYAALSCPGFPFCWNDHSIVMQWRAAFSPEWSLAMNYEGGVLPEAVRQTIHMAHRIGALAVTVYFLSFCVYVFYRSPMGVAIIGPIGALLALLLAQLCLGMMNIMLARPLWVALAHHMVANLLFLTLLAFIVRCAQLRKVSYV